MQKSVRLMTTVFLLMETKNLTMLNGFLGDRLKLVRQKLFIVYLVLESMYVYYIVMYRLLCMKCRRRFQRLFCTNSSSASLLVSLSTLNISLHNNNTDLRSCKYQCPTLRLESIVYIQKASTTFRSTVCLHIYESKKNFTKPH